MVAALALAGGLGGLLGLSVWLERKPAERTPEARIREAMRGPDGATAIPVLGDHLD